MFSVILPVYNGERFIDEAIKSVLCQSETDWELIVVNDGSEDDTLRTLEKYAGSERICILSQDNGGASTARNSGAQIARGEYLTFIDSDDIWYENHLEVMKKLIVKYPSAGLYGTFTRIEPVRGKIIEESKYFKGRGGDVLLEDFFAEYARDETAKMFTVITTCIPKEVFFRMGGFPEGCAIGEDLELSLRCAAYYPAALSKVPTAVYKRVNSTATKDKSFDPDWRFFDTVRGIYSDETIPAEKRENLKKVMGRFTMRRCRHYLIEGKRKKAFEAFKEAAKNYRGKKDLLVNLALMALPTALVRLIFSVRWRRKG